MTVTTSLSDAVIERIACGVLDHSLPKPDWTHAAHFAAALWMVRAGRDAEMPDRIRAYNLATGVENTATTGNHETITLASLAVARAALHAATEAPLASILAVLLETPYGRSDWPLLHWTRERLFSPEARASWIAPDLVALDA